MSRVVKWVAISVLLIVAAPIAYFFGYYELEKRGVFCEPPSTKSLEIDAISHVRLKFPRGRDREERNDIIYKDEQTILSLISFFDDREKDWKGIGPATAPAGSHSIWFETNLSTHHVVWFTPKANKSDTLFLSIGHCIQSVPPIEAQRFFRILDITEADQS